MSTFYGDEYADQINSEKQAFAACGSLVHFYNLLLSCWRRETAAPGCQSAWSDDNPTLGQCSITSVLIQEIYGGDIIKVQIGAGSHYFNRIAGHYVDLTRAQFIPSGITFSDEPNEIVSANTILANPEVKARYELLKKLILEA